MSWKQWLAKDIENHFTFYAVTFYIAGCLLTLAVIGVIAALFR